MEATAGASLTEAEAALGGKNKPKSTEPAEISGETNLEEDSVAETEAATEVEEEEA